MNFWKPMLAGTIPVEEINQIKLPVLVSIKYDGIRAQSAKPAGNTITRIYLYSRKGKLIPNNHIQKWAKNLAPGLEGELLIWNGTDFAPYEEVESAVMSMGGKPAFLFLCFDFLRSKKDRWLPKKKRLANLQNYVKYIQNLEWGQNLQVIEHALTSSHEQITAWLECEIDNGGEGLMVADPNASYKHGRSTGSLHDRGLMKLKPWYDDEAIVTGFSSLQKNANALQRDAHGYAKRSSHKAGKVAQDTLGTLEAYSSRFGWFNVGSGFTNLQKKEIWKNQSRYMASHFTFRYRGITKEGKPRHAKFHRFRNA